MKDKFTIDCLQITDIIYCFMFPKAKYTKNQAEDYIKYFNGEFTIEHFIEHEHYYKYIQGIPVPDILYTFTKTLSDVCIVSYDNDGAVDNSFIKKESHSLQINLIYPPNRRFCRLTKRYSKLGVSRTPSK